jgi:hypothetical protein
MGPGALRKIIPREKGILKKTVYQNRTFGTFSDLHIGTVTKNMFKKKAGIRTGRDRRRGGYHNKLMANPVPHANLSVSEPLIEHFIKTKKWHPDAAGFIKNINPVHGPASTTAIITRLQGWAKIRTILQRTRTIPDKQNILRPDHFPIPP